MKCGFQYTPSQIDGRGNTIYLDRHHVNCNSAGVVSMFHLERPDKTHVRYQYQCCSIAGHVGTCNIQEKTTNYDLDGRGTWFG